MRGLRGSLRLQPPDHFSQQLLHLGEGVCRGGGRGLDSYLQGGELSVVDYLPSGLDLRQHCQQGLAVRRGSGLEQTVGLVLSAAGLVLNHRDSLLQCLDLLVPLIQARLPFRGLLLAVSLGVRESLAILLQLFLCALQIPFRVGLDLLRLRKASLGRAHVFVGGGDLILQILLEELGLVPLVHLRLVRLGLLGLSLLQQILEHFQNGIGPLVLLIGRRLRGLTQGVGPLVIGLHEGIQVGPVTAGKAGGIDQGGEDSGDLLELVALDHLHQTATLLQHLPEGVDRPLQSVNNLHGGLGLVLVLIVLLLADVLCTLKVILVRRHSFSQFRDTRLKLLNSGRRLLDCCLQLLHLVLPVPNVKLLLLGLRLAEVPELLKRRLLGLTLLHDLGLEAL
mmetsp:Transcript_17557/g.40371  ORF Transcript_17557/g.40371 Transcript_17557/m.40371 type:complete len:393 (-) Transcript_17557:120-1298(-)